jgi:hypothetical protein
MAEDIKPTPNAGFYNTKIPSLSDNANIQQALRMYHYGTDGTVPDDSGNPVRTESVAGYLKNIQQQIDGLEYGSQYSISEPEGKENGFIWVDSDSAAPILDSPPATIPSVAKYQNDAPTSNLENGMLWVDKNSSPLKMYVYDSGTQAWREIGA